MKDYRIFHPVGGALNTKKERGVYEYELVCTVKAESLEDAFKLSQNDLSPEYRELKARSTSVGDIIVDDSEEIHYFVDNVGFEEIPFNVVQYIDWTNH